jgi:ornithine cyclodeaminase
MDDSVASRAVFYVDSMMSCMARAGDICIPLDSGVLSKDRLRGEIGSLMAGRIAGRSSDSEITVFKSLGNAAQDLVLGSKLLCNPEKVGTNFEPAN